MGFQRREASADILLPVWLPDSLREHVQGLATAEGCRVQDVILEAIERALVSPVRKRGVSGRPARVVRLLRP